MRTRVFIPFIAAMIGLFPAMNKFEARSQNAPQKSPTLFLVVGSDWRTCGDWKDWSAQFKLGYVVGHAEGISQVIGFLSDDPPSATKLKEGFKSSESVTFGELTKAVDEFCGDYRNVKIPSLNAMMLVCGGIAGFPSYDEKTMRYWRCVAAAGNDQAKIAACSNQP
jgi:hypothetical protein